MSAFHRAVRGALCIVLAATLVGWGNSEADQRKAFIAFLQDIKAWLPTFACQTPAESLSQSCWTCSFLICRRISFVDTWLIPNASAISLALVSVSAILSFIRKAGAKTFA